MIGKEVFDVASIDMCTLSLLGPSEGPGPHEADASLIHLRAATEHKAKMRLWSTSATSFRACTTLRRALSKPFEGS